VFGSTAEAASGVIGRVRPSAAVRASRIEAIPMTAVLQILPNTLALLKPGGDSGDHSNVTPPRHRRRGPLALRRNAGLLVTAPRTMTLRPSQDLDPQALWLNNLRIIWRSAGLPIDRDNSRSAQRA
jgi:hypothetical protein